MGGVHDFLPAEVPHIQPDLFVAGQGNRPGRHLDALGALHAGVETLMN